jgi:zinc transport system substrate-binding protein
VRARIVLVLIAVTVLPPAACGGEDESVGNDRTQVLAAFYPLAFAAERIGGEHVDVRNLTPPGTEPHDVELSARDVERVRAADVVLYLGSGFMPALEEALEDASGQAVDLLEGESLRIAEEEGADPHVWLDPVRFARIAERIGDALGRPEEAGRVAAEARALDQEFRDGLRDCRRRELVTSHAAFGYLADRYGLRQVAISGISPEAEPAPRELERVVKEVRGTGATTVFFETLVSSRLAETVARETGATTAVLNPIEGLTEDEIEAGEDYVSVMRANLAALREALGCD